MVRDIKKPSNAIKTFYTFKRLDNNKWYNKFGEWSECNEDCSFYYEIIALPLADEIAKTIYEKEGKLVHLELVPIDLVPRW